MPFSFLGVMLIEPKKWLALRVKEHVEALTVTHPSAMYTSDEMALNLFFSGRITELHPSYNTFFFVVKHLRDIARIWHFNTQKPILHASLTQFPQWMSLFKKEDQLFLSKLESIYRQYGEKHLLSLDSQFYGQA